MNKKIDSKKKLIHRISRLEGQLVSIKTELEKNDTDCQKASQTLRAASRSFSSLREAFVTCLLEEYYLDKPAKESDSKQYKSLLKVISS